MKQTALFFNIGRGATVNAAALTRALTEGQIAGAGLDVTNPEPLPVESPLWSMPNVILTPHVSGSSAVSAERGEEIAIEKYTPLRRRRTAFESCRPAAWLLNKKRTLMDPLNTQLHQLRGKLKQLERQSKKHRAA